MPLILSIDTSTRGCSVGLHQDGQLVANYDLLAEKSSSGMLTSLIRDVVHHAGFALADVDAYAVAKGPGSYTGLRIGVSTAKGLCFALDKPLIAINTLEAMALQLRGLYATDTLLCPLLDARRMEVYGAIFDQNGDWVMPTQAIVIDDSSFGEWLATHPIVFFGDGAAKCQPVLGHHSNALFTPFLVHPSAKTVGQLATEAFQNQQFEDVAAFEPFYLKDFMTTTPKKKALG
jgi:tRNA threonylcarbamoyladenosine biosynthesis protein TsaB